jgi:hypothetical protein
VTFVEAQNALSTPHISKSTITIKPLMKITKIGKHCTNYGRDNHNVKMCRIKKKERPTIVAI